MNYKQILHFTWKRIRNKYVVAVLVFAVWITFFDENNLIQHYQNLKKLAQLEEQQEFYKNKIRIDKQKLKELQTNDANLEKFAREQFLMKKSNEDIFIIIEE